MTGEMEGFFARLQEQAKLRKDSLEDAMEEALANPQPKIPKGPRSPAKICKRGHLRRFPAGGKPYCPLCWDQAAIQRVIMGILAALPASRPRS